MQTTITPIVTSVQAANLLRKNLRRAHDHEETWALFLNGNLTPLKKEKINIGTINSSLIDIRRIIKTALIHNAIGVIIFHNHPSGNPKPSFQDTKETERLIEACKIFDIKFIDHIILTKNNYYSFTEECQHEFE